MGRFFRFARVVCTLLGLLMLVVSFTPVMKWAVERMTVGWYEGDADVLVVLGGSMLVDGTGPHATLGHDSYLRCVYASWFIQQYRYKYVAVSGPDGLAEAMAKYLEENGAKPEQVLENTRKTVAASSGPTKDLASSFPVWRRASAPFALLIENAAHSTFENAEFVKKILTAQAGLPAHPKIVVLTSDYHTWRSRRVFEHLGMTVEMIPVPDAAKRANFVSDRWSAFETVAGELMKDVYYKLDGKI